MSGKKSKPFIPGAMFADSLNDVEAAQKSMDEKEPQTASGTIMTQIDCPECSGVFDLEGDREGETVQCPDCNARMIVRRS